MTLREVGILNARREAGRLLRRFGVESVNHVNVEGFAARLNIAILEAPLDGASAQLLVGKGRASIVLSDRLTDPAARRRAIAHELGHYVLNHPSLPIGELCSPRVREPLADQRDIEDEANGFAVRLLTP
jgi:Zn-dependent peptidase ImmA (M78 family)